MAKIASYSSTFGDLNINFIESSSGIFIGETHANNWSVKEKSNQGVGELSDVQIERVFTILQDNDNMDMTTNMGNNVLVKRGQPKETALTKIDVKVNGININNLSINSTVAIGENQQDVWRSESKSNFGSGQYIGYNNVRGQITHLDDRDVVDHYAPEVVKQVSIQNQTD